MKNRKTTMHNEKHDLFHELPEYREQIHSLKLSDQHFARLFDEYHELDQEVHRIETGIENTSDDYLNERKSRRLHLKDEIVGMLRESVPA